MFKNQEAALEKSRQITKGAIERHQEIEKANAQQQVLFNHRHNQGITLAKAKQEHEYQNAAKSNIAQLGNGIIGVTDGVIKVYDICQSSSQPTPTILQFTSQQDGKTASLTLKSAEQESHASTIKNKKTEVLENESAPKDHHLSKEQKARKLAETIVMDENKYLRDMAKDIAQLKHAKDNIKPEDTSYESYQRWCDEVDKGYEQFIPALLRQEEQQTIEKMDFNTWKKISENKYKKRIADAESSLASREKDYLHRKQKAIDEFLNYDLKINKAEQVLEMSHDDIHMVVHRNYPRPAEFNTAMNQKLALSNAKALSHPQGYNLIALLEHGRVAADESWHDMTIFFENPLDRSYLDFNTEVNTSLAEAMPEPSDFKAISQAKRMVKGGKYLALLCRQKSIAQKFDVAHDFLDKASNRIIEMSKEDFEESLYISRQVIQRVAATDQAELIRMHDELNKNLTIVSNKPNISREKQIIIDNSIEQNKREMQYQLALIDTYNQQHVNVPNSRAATNNNKQ
jgi:hypothetical protein